MSLPKPIMIDVTPELFMVIIRVVVEVALSPFCPSVKKMTTLFGLVVPPNAV
jgi:hypothetical protein